MVVEPEIKAFIRPNKVDGIVHHLKDAGFENMTISSAEGTGKLQDEDAFVSQKFSITDSEVAKLELVVNKNDVDKVVHIISEQGKTLNPGDGLIYVSNVNQIYRVKDGLKKGN
ncbi:MAG: P-II family nitrogen regulator [Bacteroidales bacterium]|nr:P-II family nitrogen regulator [Bacteroidales bacterium]MDD5517601.1 P-II family nitrogen regulator [Bacteroidales bacterium]